LEATLHECVGLACQREERVHARALLARREALACIATGGPTVLTLSAPGADLEQKNEYLNRLVGIYRRRAFTRVTSDHFESVRQRIPELQALVLFPHFEPDEILELALVGAR